MPTPPSAAVERDTWVHHRGRFSHTRASVDRCRMCLLGKVRSLTEQVHAYEQLLDRTRRTLATIDTTALTATQRQVIDEVRALTS